jgi:hypothetical protein
VNAGEAMLLEEEFSLSPDLRSKLATIIRKQESPSGLTLRLPEAKWH